MFISGLTIWINKNYSILRIKTQGNKPYLCGMSGSIKSQRNILEKLKIEQLNPMQEEARAAIHSGREVVLLSPTGTGKTLAFLLPLIAELDPANTEVQALILTPSRELTIQIEQVVREMGTGFKTNAVYGGRPFSKDRTALKHAPAILVGTPGRVADHLRRRSFNPDEIKTLVLDEFDKSLEVGFEFEMTEIIEALKGVTKKILTSATQEAEVPAFVGLRKPRVISFLADKKSKLEVKAIISPDKDKIESLVTLLKHLGDQPGIVFCNYKDSINRVSEFLEEHGIPHGCFYGGVEQIDRERALIKFRNNTYKIIVATDLAARGLDIPELKFIIHYQLPKKPEEFTHRNGRTARMNSGGTAYVIQWEEEGLPPFIRDEKPEILNIDDLKPAEEKPQSDWETLFVSGGRKDKISKGDIAGLFMKQGRLNGEQVGVIEIKQDCAFVAVKSSKVDQLIELVNNSKLKKKKVRVTKI